MKTAKDPRHKKRRDIVKALFAEEFIKQEKHSETLSIILKNKKKLDKIIADSAPTWPIEKINRIDLAILRLAVWELQNEDTPPKVIIDEAVELAKEFGSENSPSFVNGVMGSVYSSFDS
jgi:N utilization substance protein B